MSNLTARQTEIVEAVRKHGSNRKAAKALGLAESTVRGIVQRAASKDPALHTHGAPQGYHLRGASTLLDAEGRVVQTWVKTAADKQDPTRVLELFREAVAEAPPRMRSVIPCKITTHDQDLMTVYPMGDPHLGMMAWRLETGADFDLKIAEKNLFAAVDKLVATAPPSKYGRLINVGDFIHSDSSAGTTTKGTRVDVDTRWAKVLRTGIAVLVRCTDRALEKHEIVELDMQAGNHDAHTAVMLSLCLAEHYRNNPRVVVDEGPSKYHYREFGECLIGSTHGDTCKLAALAEIMACDQREAWGRTKHRYWYTGHVHHESRKELRGCIVETFRTLAASDAWHAGQGYRSGRSMVCDVLHKTRGRIMRHEVGVEELV